MLQEMGGWESIEMVRGYAHLSADHLTEHVSKIDAILERKRHKYGTREECSLHKIIYNSLIFMIIIEEKPISYFIFH